MQSNLYGKLHVALIMDGNGRWAKRRGLPRTAGHRAGADTVRRIIRAAPDLDVGDALLSALSDNECDMLVMGGYGHSRIRELALGGATRQILRSMTVPVLMSH